MTKLIYYIFGTLSVVIGIAMAIFWTYLLFTNPPHEIQEEPLFLKITIILLGYGLPLSLYIYGWEMLKKARGIEPEINPLIEQNKELKWTDMKDLVPVIGANVIGRLIICAIAGAVIFYIRLRAESYDPSAEFGVGIIVFSIIVGGALGIAAYIPLEIFSRYRKKNAEGMLELKLIDIVLLLVYAVIVMIFGAGIVSVMLSFSSQF